MATRASLSIFTVTVLKEAVTLACLLIRASANAFTPAANKEYNIAANKWTLIEVEYTHKDAIISQVGIDQRPASVKCAPTLYVDDVKVVKKAGAQAPVEPEETTLLPVTEREGKRPTPQVTGTGKTYDDLIFYTREYKAEDEKLVYQWNSTELKYELLATSGGEILDINLINGGNANG